MHLILALLAVALQLPEPYYPPTAQPETPDERRDRIEMIVEESVSVSVEPPDDWPGTSADLAALVLAVTHYESRRWAVEVHDGRVRGDNGRSCGLGQLWGRCRHVGTSREQTRRHLRDVARLLAKSAAQCRVRRIDRRGIRRVVSMYGSGKVCDGSFARPYSALWARFRRAVPPEPGPVAVAVAMLTPL